MNYLMLLVCSFSLWAQTNSYQILWERFQDADDDINYNHLLDKKCTSVKIDRPNEFIPARFEILPGRVLENRVDETYIPAKEPYEIYPNGPLFPSVKVPAQPAIHIKAKNEVILGKVVLRVNNESVRNPDSAYISQIVGREIKLKSFEYGGYNDVSRNEHNRETVIRKSGELIFFYKQAVYPAPRGYELLGYCWPLSASKDR